MVERLRMAIEKARAHRAAASDPLRADGADRPAAPAPPRGAEDPWLALQELSLDPRALMRERIIARERSDPAYLAFDTLRTRLLKMLHDNQWTRVGITSPTKGCGKTTVAANLAFSLARQAEIGSMLIDLDLRMPQLARRLGQRTSYAIEPFLMGEVSPLEYLCRVHGNLALGFNSVPVRNAAELVHSRRAAEALAATWQVFRPDVVLFDLPPMLTCDDVLAFLGNLDGVLLVIGGGETKADEIEECERLLADHTNLLGMVLNKAEDSDGAFYYYEYA